MNGPEFAKPCLDLLFRHVRILSLLIHSWASVCCWHMKTKELHSPRGHGGRRGNVKCESWKIENYSMDVPADREWAAVHVNSLIAFFLCVLRALCGGVLEWDVSGRELTEGD